MYPTTLMANRRHKVFAVQIMGSSVPFKRCVVVPDRGNLLQIRGQEGGNRSMYFIPIDMATLMRQQPWPQISPTHEDT
jgi:hypothetical protein